LQSHRPEHSSLGDRLRIDQLCNTEIEQLWDTLRCDENIARLKVAMNHQSLVRVMYCGADLTEQLKPLRDRKLKCIAVGVDAVALDQFHDQVWNPVFRGSAIQKTRDVGMIEGSEDLPLMSKALQQDRAVVSAPDQLDGHSLFILAVGSHRAIDLTHPTLT